MGIRNGQQLLDSLREDDREIWIDGERVKDVTTDPRFGGAAQSLAELYDLQATDPDKYTYEHPELKERVGLSYIWPQSTDDLIKRRNMVKGWMDATSGMFGRSPDFMNIHLAGFAAAHKEFGREEKQWGENIRNFYLYCAKNDISMTHTLLNPQVDRSRPVQEQDKDLAARVIKETDEGIVIRGARMVATLCAFSHEIMVMPSTYISNDPKAAPYAFGFSIPISSPGLKFICRPSVIHREAASPMDYPLSSRLDEQDAMVIFNDVLVPWERVFIYQDPDMCNGLYLRTGTMPQIMHQFATKNLSKAEFMMGVAFSIVDSMKTDQFLNVTSLMSELINFTEMTRACIRAAEEDAEKTPHGTVTPAANPLWVVRMMFPQQFIRMCEIIQIVAASGMVSVPSYNELSGPQAENVERYFQAADRDSRSRLKLMRLAADASISSFSGRQQLYERYYSGDPVRLAKTQYDSYNTGDYRDKIWSLLDELEERQNGQGAIPPFTPKAKAAE